MDDLEMAYEGLIEELVYQIETALLYPPINVAAQLMSMGMIIEEPVEDHDD